MLGYCFLLFQDEMSVQSLIEACITDDDKLYWCVSSPTMKDKPVSTTKVDLLKRQQKMGPGLGWKLSFYRIYNIVIVQQDT